MIRLPLLIACVIALLSANTWAQPAAAPEIKAEAASRFNRGLRLADQGDNAGALAEFKRAHELLPNRLVLTNIGLIYAALGRPVEATDALDRALSSQAPGDLPAELLTRARRVRQEQAERIGHLAITCNVPAAIDVGGVDVGRTPLPPVRVASGTVVVGAAAPGRLTSRREITVAGGATVAIAFTLLPTDSALAHLRLRSGLPGAEVFIDGASAGHTPLSAPLALPPGDHVIELRRPGYRSASTQVSLTEGARLEIGLELEEDAAAAEGAPKGQLVLSASEPDVQLFIDERPRGALTERGQSLTLALPPGPHHVRIERPGFAPFTRALTLEGGVDPSPLHALLVPTPETRLEYVADARATRRWSIVALSTGAVLALGGAGVATWADGSLSGARDRLMAEEKAQSFEGGSGPCDPAAGPPDDVRAMCEGRLRDLRNEVSHRKLARTLGLAGAGVGVAALATGLYLYLHGDDPARYDRLAGLRITPALVAGGASVVLHNDF